MAKHLNAEERDLIAQLFNRGFSKAEIASRLGRHRSTLTREFQLNSSGSEYLAIQAHQQARRRRTECVRPHKMDEPEMNLLVRNQLKDYWSPQQIAGRMKLKHERSPFRRVSCQTIYNWIKSSAIRVHWESFLRRRGKRPRRKSSENIEQNRSIEHRPKVIEQRKRLGDFEGDTVLGSLGTGGMVTLVDRRSRYTLLLKIKAKTSSRVLHAIRKRLRVAAELQLKSITFDNGTEFASVDRLENTERIKLYWAKPGCPHQRGTNENTNGLTRQFFPKGIDFRTVTPQRVRNVENLINNRPRACLGYRTPNEVHLGISADVCCNSS